MFFFTASDGSVLYMGKDKHENESLIKHGWPEDVWFHVDNLSSAHVYLRLPARTDAEAPPASASASASASSSSALRWDALPEALLAECGQLCKANSIEGSKKASVAVIYTPWSNLRKDGSMDVGQVGFVDAQLVRRVHVGERDKDALRRLGATKQESFPDLAEERRRRDASLKGQQKQEARERAKRDKELEEQRRKLVEERSYDRLFGAAGGGGGGGAGGDALPPPPADVSLARQVRAQWRMARGALARARHVGAYA
jgi:predicted ribosome quality control (RQC) complex YloA/Tae2 family protein